MLRVIRALAEQPYVAALCREAQIAVDTWLAVAINDAIDADTRTGRGMRTSQTVAAARVGRSERTVRRARAISVRLGVLVELYRGRELSKAERLALVTDSPGHRQRGLPNTYACTVCGPRQRARISIPRPGEYAQVNAHVDGFVHLPFWKGLAIHHHLLELLPSTAAKAAEDTEPPAAARHKGKRRRGVALAGEVLAHPGLAMLLDGVRPGTLTGQLALYEHGGWHGHALATALLEQATWAGIPTWEPARSPWGLLKMLLSRIDPVVNVHLGLGRPDGGVDELQGPAARPAPCGSPECDGHGWVNTLDEHGNRISSKCRHCPPQARAAWVNELAVNADLGDPAF